MLNFLEGARLIKIRSSSQSPIPSPSESESGETTIDAGNGKIVIHKHHDDVPFAVIPICAIFFTFAYLIVKAIMAPFTNRNRQAQSTPVSGGLSEEEVAILHKLQRTLSQMESRVEALETILIDQSRTEKNYGSKL